MSRKLFLGPRLRRLREQHQLSQLQCAQRLGISHSYLNQLENNQRPLTASVLIKIAGAFNIDIGRFSDDGDDQLTADIHQALKDPALAGNANWQDLQTFVQQQPDLAATFSQLYRHYARLREEHEQLVSRFYGEQHQPYLSPLPHEEVRDFFFRHNNHIEDLDRAAETLFDREKFGIGQLHRQLRDYLQDKLAIRVDIQIITNSGDAGLIRAFDPESRRLVLAAQLSRAQQTFQMASQIAFCEYQPVIDELCGAASFHSGQAGALAAIGLANYFAGALLMPYRPFLTAAEQLRYDIEALQTRFHVSTEQVCHRLSTLQRQGQRGVPFYFVRVDQAGNISKRQSATSFHFARTGGACPLWNVHEAFSSPQQVLTQVAQMPDGQLYFCIARQVSQGGGSYRAMAKHFAVGLGCELEHAHRLVYADGLDLTSKALVTPIGPGCRVCPRQGCPQRAFPPAGQALNVDSNRQHFAPYDFAQGREVEQD